MADNNAGLTPEELAEKRRHELHELKLEKIRMWTALITAVATLGAAVIGAAVKTDDIGAKVNQERGAPVSLIANLTVGVKVLSSLADRQQPLSAAIPGVTDAIRPTPAPPVPVAEKPPTAAPAAIDSETLSTNPAVLKQCYGLGSTLELQRVRVEPVANGYEISMRLRNTSSLPEALLVVGPIKLTDARVSVEGQSNVGTGPFYAAGTNDQKQLAELFSVGGLFDAGQIGALNFEFRPGGQFSPAKYVTFGATLLHYTKAADGTYSRQNTTMTCQDIPVLPPAA